MDYFIEKKTWDDFNNSNLFTIVNILLRIFGWGLQYETNEGKISNVYPIRIKRR